MEQLINFTDAVFLGHVSTVALGASAIAGIYYMALYMIGFGFSLGLQVVIARRNGEQQFRETGKTFFQGLFFLVGIALVLFTLSQAFTPLILRQLVTSDEIYHTIVRYLYWRNFGLLFAFPALAFRSFYVGITNTKILTTSAITAAILNIILNYVLIFGFGTFPALGFSGAAIASSLAEAGALLVLLLYTKFKTNKQHYGLQIQLDKSILKQVFQISVWSMLQAFISVAPWLLFFIAIEHLGENQLAVANIIRSISTLFFIIVHSFAATTGSLVSNLVGAGNSKGIGELCSKVIRMGYAIGIPLLILSALFSEEILGIYTNDTTLIKAAFAPFMVMLLNYFGAVPAYVFMSTVGGLGNTKIAFVFQIVTIFIYLAYLHLISSYLQVPLAVYWTSEHLYVLSLLLFSVIYLKRIRPGKSRPEWNEQNSLIRE